MKRIQTWVCGVGLFLLLVVTTTCLGQATSMPGGGRAEAETRPALAVRAGGVEGEGGAASQPAVVVVNAGGAAAKEEVDRSFVEELRVGELFSKNSLGRWVLLLGLIFLAIGLGKVVTFLLERVAYRLEKRGWHSQAEVFSGATSPATLALFTVGLSIGLGNLAMSELLMDAVKRILLLLYTVAVFWYAFNLVSVIEVALKKFAAKTDTTLDDELVPVIRKALRVFIVVIGALFILQNVFNRDIGAWLAGLGIAGLAVSLAAQDSLKNLFGSMTILFDRPFTVGQRIKFQRFEGVVEEIGFRSTKVRTPDGSIVTIPNSNIVNDPVDNWAVRQKIFRNFTLAITYDTPLPKMREAVAIVQRLFDSEEFRPFLHDADKQRNQDPPRVFFTDFAADNLTIKVWYWYRPADWWGYCDMSQRFNLRLMEEFAKAGIEFALPTRTLFLAGDAKRHLDLHVRDVIDGEGMVPSRKNGEGE
jgi:MscS family membrane protein